MDQIGVIIGIFFLAIGSLSVVYGTILCYTTKGEYFHDEEVRMLLAREATENRRRLEEEEIRAQKERDDAKNDEGKKKKRGIIIAS